MLCMIAQKCENVGKKDAYVGFPFRMMLHILFYDVNWKYVKINLSCLWHLIIQNIYLHCQVSLVFAVEQILFSLPVDYYLS